MRNGDPKRIGTLYFISSETQNAIKIGFADDVYMRLKTLQTGNPDELKLLASIPCLAEAETLLHRQLKHKRLRLEWYPADEEIETLICELQDDMFDAAIEAFDPPADASLDDISRLLSSAYSARPLPTSLILKRVRECQAAEEDTPPMAEQEWKVHAGQGDPKLTGNPMVEVCFRDGETMIGRMFDWDQNWQWADLDEASAGDIVAYRTLPPAPNGE